MKLKVSDSEYYILRKRIDDSGIYFMLSPYSCMNPLSLYLDKLKKEVSIYLRNELLYKGALDLSILKEELERINKLNAVEKATLLNLLSSYPEIRGYATGRISPIDRLIFSLAYESSEELKKLLEESMKSTDFEKLLYLLKDILETLPQPLREPMLRKLKPYLPKKEKKLEKPLIKKKKRKKKKVVIYA